MIASIGVVPIVFFTAAAGVLSIWHYSRSRSLVRNWARANGYEILEAELREFRMGPFLWTSGRDQTVYHIRVRSSDGT